MAPHTKRRHEYMHSHAHQRTHLIILYVLFTSHLYVVVLHTRMAPLVSNENTKPRYVYVHIHAHQCTHLRHMCILCAIYLAFVRRGAPHKNGAAGVKRKHKAAVMHQTGFQIRQYLQLAHRLRRTQSRLWNVITERMVLNNKNTTY